MSLEQLARWLRCPNCGADLFPTAQLTIGCASGHRFDVNKRGYVTLVNTRGASTGDTAQMLNDRATVLNSGAYSPIVDALLALLPLDSGPRVLDAGCGTGYYLRRVLEASADATGLALDRSPVAVRIATRTDDRVSGLVADTWQPLPIRNAVSDVILNVFAPRNPAEFHRVLRAGGSLLVVVPKVGHLHELRQNTQMLTVPDGKLEHVEAQLAPLFRPSECIPVEFRLPLGSGHAELLREMGPSAFHELTPAQREPSAVTVSVDVVCFDRVETSPA
jgi:23S rRNA (guanine745-N1)-methyltransferase